VWFEAGIVNPVYPSYRPDKALGYHEIIIDRIVASR
jgi:hypothetical protein